MSARQKWGHSYFQFRGTRNGDILNFARQWGRPRGKPYLSRWWNAGEAFAWPHSEIKNVPISRHACVTAARHKPKIKNVPVSRQHGLTYVEILIATVILVIGLVPALDALRASMLGGTVTEAYVVDQHRMTGRFEEVLAESFDDLDAAALAAASPTAPSSYSDAPGTTGRIIINIARYDGDNADGDGNPFTGGDEGLLWVRAETKSLLDGTETLISR